MQLRLLATGDDWMTGLCRDLTANVKILGLKLVDGRDVAHFVDITTMTECIPELKKHLRDSAILSTELTEISPNHLMGVVTSNDCKVCTRLIETDSASFVSSAETGDDCALMYKLFLASSGVPQLLNNLSKNGVAYRIEEISSALSERRLTAKQLDMLKAAMDMGLYDFPRRITHEELALKLGIKPSTLSESLRSAEKKIVGSYLAGSSSP